MYGIEWMRLLAKEAKVEELKNYRLEDGTVLAIFLNEMRGKYVVAQYDRSDIELWEMEFDEAHDAWTEFNKRVAQGPVDQRTGAKR